METVVYTFAAYGTLGEWSQFCLTFSLELPMGVFHGFGEQVNIPNYHKTRDSWHI